MKLIDKDKVAAEIEKRLKTNGAFDEIGDAAWWEDKGMCDAYKSILSFINTLEVKEINNVWYNAKRTIPEDGHEQIICIKEDGLAVATVGKIVNGTIKWAYLNDLLDTSSFNVESKEVDLDLEITLWANAIPEIRLDDVERLAKYFYELGFNAQKGK